MNPCSQPPHVSSVGPHDAVPHPFGRKFSVAGNQSLGPAGVVAVSRREKLCKRERLTDRKTIDLADAVRSQESLSFHIPIPNRGRCSVCCFSEPQFSGRRRILGTHVSYLFRLHEIVSGFWSKTPQADSASFSPPLPKVSTFPTNRQNPRPFAR